MSGGAFDYLQFRIGDIETEIQHLIDTNEDSTLNEWGYTKGNFYSLETIEQFKNCVTYLKLARIYATRIDWLVSGDDGEENFHKRLAHELDEEFPRFSFPVDSEQMKLQLISEVLDRPTIPFKRDLDDD